MRRQITDVTWQQIKTTFASGIGLRGIARNMNIPSRGMAETICATDRAKKDGVLVAAIRAAKKGPINVGKHGDRAISDPSESPHHPDIIPDINISTLNNSVLNSGALNNCFQNICTTNKHHLLAKVAEFFL